MKAETDKNFPTYRLKRTVVLVGMMGSGKTAIGKALSQKLDVPFRDSDDEIVAASQQSIAEIFERDGEGFFRKREAEVIQRLLSLTPGVLSTGGGAFLRQENRDNITNGGVSVWLDAPLDLLWDRVKGKDTRPLLLTDNPLETLSSIYADRTPIYQLAGKRLQVEAGASIEETTKNLIAVLERDPSILERLE